MHQSLIQMGDLLGIDAGIFPAEVKAGRDHADPFWREKQAAEKALYLAMQAAFAAQQKRIHDKIYFLATAVAHKSNPIDDALNDEFWANEEFLLRGLLVDFYQRNAQRSIGLNNAWTQSKFGIVFDDTLTNADAATWARKYAAKLVRQINQTTRTYIREQVATWIETPGATLKDLMDTLPFGEARASRIAITETTKAFSAGEQMFTEGLQGRYMGLKIVRIWSTNNDDRVCPICGALNGKQIRAGKQFLFDGEYFGGPPAHVGCRCWSLSDIVLPGEK